jgi:two-component sensor histidine kinase
MIARTLMYREELRRTWKRAAGITVGVALVSATLNPSMTRWPGFFLNVGAHLIISFCVGTLFWFSAPLVRHYVDRLHPIPRWAVRVFSAAIILNAGFMIGIAVLDAMGAFPGSPYWAMVRGSFVPTTVIGVLCFTGFTMYETLKYKAQYETAQARLSSLESRLQPHFLFNTLNSIMALIPEDPEAAERMTERLAALLRYSLDATEHRTVRLEQEVKVATDYLEIEKMRFGERLSYFIDVPDELMREEVPPFSLQTLVENSVKYGGSEIRISARMGDGRLMLRVWDSGEGFPNKVDLPTGHGLHNLKERLDALWGGKAAVEFPRERPGTTVQISMPAASPTVSK